MQREWAEIRDEVLRFVSGIPEEDRPEAARRMKVLMSGFLERHQQALAHRAGDSDRLEPVRFAQHFQRYFDAERAYQRGVDALLIATADKADAERAVSIQILQNLEDWEALPESVWEAMTPAERKEGYEALEHLREQRDAVLAELPLEQRQEWERRLGL